MPRLSPPTLLFSVWCASAFAAPNQAANSDLFKTGVPPVVAFAEDWTGQKPARPVSKNAALMTLEHAYDLAAASDQALRIAFINVRRAELLPWKALTKVTPRLTGGVGYSRSSTSFSNSEFAGQHQGVMTADLSLQQPLLDMSVFPARRRGRIAVESSRLGRQFTIRETLFGVAAAYFEVLKGERVVDVNRQSLALAQEQETLARKRADVGEVTRSDVLRAQVSVETARRALITSENDLEFQRNTLRNVLNLAPDAQLRLAEPLPYRRDVPEFGTLLARAYEHREDLREQTLAVQQAEQGRLEVRAQYAPKIVAQGGPSYSDRSSASPSGSQRTWQAGVSVQVPFFTGGQREIDLASAGYDIDQASVEKERLLKSIESEVKKAWLNVQTLEGSLRAVRALVQAAEQGYKDLQNQYSAGTAKSVDVLSALKDLSVARSDLATLALDYQVALRALEQVTGTFQDPRVQQLTGKPR
jgi:outer membrane protein TolC